MQRFDQINVIPFIDIMLVLLAIVLTTATFISQGQIDINLPVADSTGQVQKSQEKSLVITIDTKQKIYLDDKAIDLDSLSRALGTVDKKTAIVFRVDKQVIFEHFVQVIDLLKENNLERFSIVTVEK